MTNDEASLIILNERRRCIKAMSDYAAECSKTAVKYAEG